MPVPPLAVCGTDDSSETLSVSLRPGAMNDVTQDTQVRESRYLFCVGVKMSGRLAVLMMFDE